MQNITIICSRHEELGSCNSNELFKIIDKISPEIIFNEIDPSSFDLYCKEPSKRTLETKAILMYLEKHQIKHIPVDTYDLTNIYKEDLDYMYNQISNKSIEYYNLAKNQFIMTSQYGFRYLNSNECSETIKELQDIEENVIKNTHDEKLSHIYKLWLDLNSKREYEIINNIYTFSHEYFYNKAILIIGAEHRESIISKIKKQTGTEGVKLTWNYSNYENIL